MPCFYKTGGRGFLSGKRRSDRMHACVLCVFACARRPAACEEGTRCPEINGGIFNVATVVVRLDTAGIAPPENVRDVYLFAFLVDK